jgi:elongator complex protein 3
VNIGEIAAGRAQHSGLGTQLIERAADIAIAEGYARLAVISAIGTREYYRKRGFADGTLYQIRTL